jgi:hypothetical protein
MKKGLAAVEGKKIYLAIPYTEDRELSFKIANEVAAQFISLKAFPFSPISHSHPLAMTGLCANNHETWMKHDQHFVDWADELFVIVPTDMNGINSVLNSKGVLQEITWALESDKPIHYIRYSLENKVITPYGNS